MKRDLTELKQQILKILYEHDGLTKDQVCALVDGDYDLDCVKNMLCKMHSLHGTIGMLPRECKFKPALWIYKKPNDFVSDLLLAPWNIDGLEFLRDGSY